LKRRWPALALALGLAASLALSPKPVLAQPASSATSRRSVAVEIAGPHDEARLLEETIRELLARLQLTMVGRSTSRGALLATVEIAIAPSGTAHVVVRSADGAPVLERDVPRETSTSIQREQIAHAVRGAAEAELLADDDRVAGGVPTASEPVASTPAPNVERTEEPEPRDTPPPSVPKTAPLSDRDTASVEPAASDVAIDLSTFAGGGPVGGGARAVARVGGAIALASRRGLRPSVAVSALYAFPFTSGTDTVSSRTSLVSGRAMGSIELLRRSWLALDASGGGGVDVLSVHPSSTTLPASALGSSTTRFDPVLSAGITARIALVSDVVLLIGVVADADVTARHYVFADRGQQVDVLDPWRVRPMLLAGLSFTALGEAPFRPTRTP
jgi:hypothetical protein